AYVDKSGDARFLSRVSPAGRADPIYGGASSTRGRALVYYATPPSMFATAPGDIALDGPTSFHNKSDTVQATVRTDLGFADLTSSTEYRHDDSPYYGDLDATALTQFNIFVGPVDETVSQEFLLNSKPGGPLQWTAGVDYFRIRDTWDVGADFGGGF